MRVESNKHGIVDGLQQVSAEIANVGLKRVTKNKVFHKHLQLVSQFTIVFGKPRGLDNTKRN
jgi:hypothetical protein